MHDYPNYGQRIWVLEWSVVALTRSVTKLKKEHRIMAESIQSLRDEVVALKASAQAREERDIAQDTVTAQNIALLNTRIAALEEQLAAGGLSPELQALLDASVGDLKAIRTSLDA